MDLVKLNKYSMNKFITKLNQFLPIKMKQFLKNNKCFVSGSFVLELLHDESYYNSDLDIFCSCDDEIKIYSYFKKHINLNLYSLEYNNPLMRYTNVKNVYTCVDYTRKIQLVILNSSFDNIFNNFENYCDINACSSRIIYIKNKFYIKAHLDKNTHLNKEYIDMMFKKNGIIYTTRLANRIEKYTKRGYTIDTSILDTFICSICQEKLISLSDRDNIIYNTDCNHLYHYECIYSWCLYDFGDQIIKSKSCCPICNHFLDKKKNKDLEICNIKLFDFERYIYTYCIICGFIFTQERGTCNENNENHNMVCINCSLIYDMDRYNSLKGKLISCPNCRLELQHNGGCAQFTCCLYGNDKCKKELCDHGSTNNIKFCGYRWMIS